MGIGPEVAGTYAESRQARQTRRAASVRILAETTIAHGKGATRDESRRLFVPVWAAILKRLEKQ
jgi:hypothetical protein